MAVRPMSIRPSKQPIELSLRATGRSSPPRPAASCSIASPISCRTKRSRSPRSRRATTASSSPRCRASSVEAEFAVIIIFDDPRFLFLRPVEKLEPSRQAHGDGEWELVGGRHESKTRGILGARPRNDHPGLIHRTAHELCARGLNDAGKAQMTGILDHGSVTRLEHGARHEIDRRLGAGANDDLVRCAADAA